MHQEREESKGPEEEKKDSGSDSEGLDKSDSGNEERDEKEDMLSPSLPSMGYPYVNSIAHEDDKDGKFLMNSDKGRLTSQKAASPLVIQWLQDNYEGADGTSLPRSTLYTHYVGFCSSMNIEPVNAASFGKLIRSIFPNLKTRRLGTRGHSKYHYYGIQIKASSDLRLPAFHPTESAIGTTKTKNRLKKDFEAPEKVSPQNVTTYDSPVTITAGATLVQLPDFSLSDNLNLPNDISIDHAHAFMNNYRKHCQTLVDHVYRQQFQEVEKILRLFWQTLPPQFRSVISIPEIVDQIGKKDHLTYKAMTHVLLPNVLQALPVSIPQAIRQFSKSLEPWLSVALEGLPSNVVMKKLFVAKRFAQSLHKQASLNHLTQAARAVLLNTGQVSQMILDWNRLDFEFIKSQASWVCQCGDDLILSAQEDFKKFLTERVGLEQWASWLQDIVSRVLGKSNDSRELVYYSQQLLLKWSFYSTLIIRDLTIRNATSFGSFHLLRTLFDEYIFYLVDTKLASIPQQMMQQEPMMGYSHSHESNSHTTSSVDSFSLDNLLNKENPRLSAKHLPFPFQDTNHERMGPSDDDYSQRLDMVHNDNMLHMQPQYPRMNPSYGSNPMYPKTVEELRMVASSLDRLNPSLKRTHDPVLKPPSTMMYSTLIPDSIRSQLPNGHSLESLIQTTQHYRDNTTDSNKKMRKSMDGTQTAEVK